MNPETNASGLILIDKKPGITSMNVDSCIKKMLGTKKVGHHGTLDPFATGLLPVYVGKGLKFVRYADDFDKTYRCVAVFGRSTDSMDKDGEVVSENIPGEEELERLEANGYKDVREAFARTALITEQIPPKFSAKKINGRKAYELARKGIEAELKPHKVRIYSLTVDEITRTEDSFKVVFTVDCSKGTYIRSICDEVGKITGYGAYAESLRRLKCGPFDVRDAYTEERIAEMVNAGDMSFIRPAQETLSFMPEICLGESEYRDVRLGRKISAVPHAPELAGDTGIRYRAVYNGNVAAVMYRAFENDSDILRIERMLASDD